MSLNRCKLPDFFKGLIKYEKNGYLLEMRNKNESRI